MMALLEHDERQERILQRYFAGRHHHWGRWLTFILLVSVVSLTVLELWQPSLLMNMILLARSYAPAWFPMQELDNAIEAIMPYAQNVLAQLQGWARTIPIPDYLFQQFRLDKSKQDLLVLGIALPIVLFVLYLVVWTTLAVIAAVVGWLTPWHNEVVYFDNIANNIDADQNVDQLVKKRIEILVQRAFRRLNIEPDEMVTTEPLVIQAPILWLRQGVTFNDLQWRVGKDRKPRFGVFRVLIMYLTHDYLCIHSCYYNLIKGAIAHESVEQHLYSQVVRVTLQDYGDDIVLKLRSGRKATVRRQFRINYADGEKLTMTIDGGEVSREVGITQNQESNAEKVFRTLDNFLKERNRPEGRP